MTVVEFLVFRQMSGGLPSLDVRWLGFSPQEGQQWVQALGPTGQQTVLVWHYLTFDLVFPALLACALASLILYFGEYLRGFRVLGDKAKTVFAVGSVLPFIVFDYAQNWFVWTVLVDPHGAHGRDFALASMFGILKFLSFLLAAIVVAVFAIGSLRRRA